MSQYDAEQLAYAQARGIAPIQARTLIATAFINEIVNLKTITTDVIKQRIQKTVSN